MMELLRRKITKDESRDTGMAMVLLMLLVYVAMKRPVLLVVAIVLHVLNMTIPLMYRPAAVVWLSLSHILGMVVSRVLLSVVYCCVVTPIGFVRRLMGKDPLMLRAFKKTKESAMSVRNHSFTARDLTNPF